VEKKAKDARLLALTSLVSAQKNSKFINLEIGEDQKKFQEE